MKLELELPRAMKLYHKFSVVFTVILFASRFAHISSKIALTLIKVSINLSNLSANTLQTNAHCSQKLCCSISMFSAMRLVRGVRAL